MDNVYHADAGWRWHLKPGDYILTATECEQERAIYATVCRVQERDEDRVVEFCNYSKDPAGLNVVCAVELHADGKEEPSVESLQFVQARLTEGQVERLRAAQFPPTLAGILAALGD